MDSVPGAEGDNIDLDQRTRLGCADVREDPEEFSIVIELAAARVADDQVARKMGRVPVLFGDRVDGECRVYRLGDPGERNLCSVAVLELDVDNRRARMQHRDSEDNGALQDPALG